MPSFSGRHEHAEKTTNPDFVKYADLISSRAGIKVKAKDFEKAADQLEELEAAYLQLANAVDPRSARSAWERQLDCIQRIYNKLAAASKEDGVAANGAVQ